jgi:hypothetical protein
LWKARVTVETPDGKKTQSVCTFLPDDQVKMPVEFGGFGKCTIEIRPYITGQKKDEPEAYDRVTYSIFRPLMLASEGNTFTEKEIFSVLLPVVFGKDQQVLKCAEGTVTVRLSGSEDKE